MRPSIGINENFSSHSLLTQIYDPQNGLQNSDDIILLPKTLIIWVSSRILRLLLHTVDQSKMSSAERDSYLSESSGSENLSDIWSDDGEEKEKELYYRHFPELLATNS